MRPIVPLPYKHYRLPVKIKTNNKPQTKTSKQLSDLRHSARNFCALALLSEFGNVLNFSENSSACPGPQKYFF